MAKITLDVYPDGTCEILVHTTGPVFLGASAHLEHGDGHRRPRLVIEFKSDALFETVTHACGLAPVYPAPEEIKDLIKQQTQVLLAVERAMEMLTTPTIFYSKQPPADFHHDGIGALLNKATSETADAVTQAACPAPPDTCGFCGFSASRHGHG